MSEPYEVQGEDADGKKFGAYRVDITSWFGLQAAGKYSAAVGFNLDGTTDSTMDGDFLTKMYNLFPTDVRPFVNAILTSRQGQRQYRDSLKSDVQKDPALANIWQGAGADIPIIVSDAVPSDADTVTS